MAHEDWMAPGIRHVRIGFQLYPQDRSHALLHVTLVDNAGQGVVATVPLKEEMISSRLAEYLASALNDGLKTALRIWDDPDAMATAVGMTAKDVAQINELKVAYTSVAALVSK